jgi:hypothetical protein
VVREVVQALTIEVFFDAEVVIDGFVLHGFAWWTGLAESVGGGVAEGDLIEFFILF